MIHNYLIAENTSQSHEYDYLLLRLDVEGSLLQGTVFTSLTIFKFKEQEIMVYSKFPNYVYFNSSTVQKNIFIEKERVTNLHTGLAKKRQVMFK